MISHYKGDIEPGKNVVFVFGSNPIGINGNRRKRTGGAALVAVEKFGVGEHEVMNVIKERGKQVKSTIDKLSSGICPLCGSRIEPQALDDYHKQREDLLKSYNEQKVLYDKDCEDLKELQSRARTEAETINSKINKLNNEISKINLQQKLLANNYDNHYSSLK